jgi:hypothetical protein
MATNAEIEKLVEILKFTPCTYTISVSGYGREHVVGYVPNQSSIKYLKDNNIQWEHALFMDLDDWVEDGHKLPDHPLIDEDDVYARDWSELDDIYRCWGAEQGVYTYISIDDENGDPVIEFSTDYETLTNLGVSYESESEVDIDNVEKAQQYRKKGRWIAEVCNFEEGTFFVGDIELTQPFDITKLLVYASTINESPDIINGVIYDNNPIDYLDNNIINNSIESNLIDLEEWI